MTESTTPERLWRDLCLFHIGETRQLTDRLMTLLAEIDAMHNRLAEAEQRGRLAERAEIVAALKERADQRYKQAKVCRQEGGWWEMVYAKATEAEACRSIVRQRTKIEALPNPDTTETTP